jgi:hypothetical protein
MSYVLKEKTEKEQKESRIFMGCILTIIVTMFAPPAYLIASKTFLKESIEMKIYYDTRDEYISRYNQMKEKYESETCMDKVMNTKIKGCIPSNPALRDKQ